MYKMSKALAWNEVDNGAVVLVQKTGEYLHLDSEMCDLVKKLDSKISLPDVIDDIISRYQNVSPEQIRSDYQEAVKTLVAKGVIKEVKEK